MPRFRNLLLGAALIFASVALFFVGREAASWRPHLVSKGGLNAIKRQRNHAEFLSMARLALAGNQAKNGQVELFATSSNGQWIARGFKVRASREDVRFEVRRAKDGTLRSKILFDFGDFRGVELSPRGSYLVVRFDDDFQAGYDTRTGDQLWVRPGRQILFSGDESLVVHARQFLSRHGDGGVGIWTSHPKTGHKIRSVVARNAHILLPIWFDGIDHIRFADSKDNLWRVRVR